MHRLVLHLPTRSVVRLLALSVITFSLVVGGIGSGWGPSVQAQLAPLPADAGNNPFTPPDSVRREGEYETAPIRSPLDNKELFEVTAPTIVDRKNPPDGQVPVEVRARDIESRLWRVFYRTTNADKTPVVGIAMLNGRPVIQISDDQSSRPVRVVTVTEPDADFNGKTLNELAQEWQKILRTEMVRFKRLTNPDVILNRLVQAFQLLVGLVIASAVIWFLRHILSRRQRVLEARYQEQLAAIAEAETSQQSQTTPTTSEGGSVEAADTETSHMANMRSQFLATLQKQFSLKRRLDVDKFLKWALFWIFILMWYVGIAHIISTVPLLMRWSIYVWTTPLVLLVIWFGISFVIRVSNSVIDRVMNSWKINPLLPFGEAQRIALRTATISAALKGLVTFVLVVVGIVWTLSLFNVPTGSILAGGAVIGFAISFGSQNLIKDLINGCFILIEDQFAVGDVIQVGDKGGLVENLNLRVTQLRNGEGQLITIPNSTITDVSNLTRLWSRIDFSIVVAYDNDPKQVLAVLQHVAQQLYSEPEWRDRMPEPPEVLGIDDISHAGMLVRVWIKTAPMQQWSVGREFRLRVRLAFEAHQIQIGRPQWINYVTTLNQPKIDNYQGVD